LVPVVLVLLVVVLAVLWSVQRRLIYFPAREAPVATAGAEDVVLETSDGLRLSAWLVRAAAAASAPSAAPPAVLVTPGNAGNRADRLPLAATLVAAGLTVLLLDYRGYGGNPGSPSEDGLARDARAGWNYLTGHGFPPERIVLFGESLGAAVATRLAADLTGPGPRGLVLRSPFASLAAVGREHYPFLPVSALLRDRYEVVERVGGIRAPTIVVYGTSDTVVPPAQSRTVARAAANLVDVVAVDGADHNDLALGAGHAAIDAVVRLAQRR
jgi:alpha-beta hydrolase superfamily lysophospholipase